MSVTTTTPKKTGEESVLAFAKEGDFNQLLMRLEDMAMIAALVADLFREDRDLTDYALTGAHLIARDLHDDIVDIRAQLAAASERTSRRTAQ